MASVSTAGSKLPLPYTIFFLFIEPIATLVGAFYAYFRPLVYLHLTHATSAPATLASVPLSSHIVLTQLANLYFCFALNEAVVLRATSDLRVWRALLICLLVADFGHLYSVKIDSLRVYWDVAGWNAIDWGNVGFVYVGASMRIAFLTGIGFSVPSSTSSRPTRNLKKV
ncbi:MAG: hypothetical protein M1825_006337 [Sarcosagium campestre]|nr:MAG: hypothetical protein M1825_006337 [Sarcosagium campestre]